MNARQVILVRHAHADWPHYQGRDFDRPLTPRGEADASAVGRALQAAGHVPGMMLASPARRTRQTALLLAAELGVPVADVHFVDALYNATPEVLDAQLQRGVRATDGLVMLVAHNPGISELGRRLGSRTPFAPADWRLAQLNPSTV